MAETQTTALKLIKPEIGGSHETWGNRLNEDMDKLDAAYVTDHNAILSGIQSGANAGTIVKQNPDGTVAATYNLADEVPFRVMQNLLFYADTLIDDPFVDIPADRPGALVSQGWVKALIDAIFPIGTILLWGGTDVDDIPDGWLICDGRTYVVDGVSRVTPNLSGRFILAAYDPAVADKTGMYPGDSVGTAGSFGHTHTITVLPYALTDAQIPPHTHGTEAAGSDNIVGRTTSGGTYNLTSVTGGLFAQTNISDGTAQGLGGQPHSHGATSSSNNAAPPYWALLYIMKVQNFSA